MCLHSYIPKEGRLFVRDWTYRCKPVKMWKTSEVVAFCKLFNNEIPTGVCLFDIHQSSFGVFKWGLAGRWNPYASEGGHLVRSCVCFAGEISQQFVVTSEFDPVALWGMWHDSIKGPCQPFSHPTAHNLKCIGNELSTVVFRIMTFVQCNFLHTSLTINVQGY